MISRNFVLYPSRPLTVKGKARTAWLKIDPSTYRVCRFQCGPHSFSLVLSNWKEIKTQPMLCPSPMRLPFGNKQSYGDITAWHWDS